MVKASACILVNARANQIFKSYLQVDLLEMLLHLNDSYPDPTIESF